MSSYGIIQIDDNAVITDWGSVETSGLMAAMEYFMKMNDPEQFFIVLKERNSMIPLVTAYRKVKGIS